VSSDGAWIDHLVIAAQSLDQGVRWCQETLGATPGPGGKHAFMGTHNRLLSLVGEGRPRTYLEIIAIDPQAPAPLHPRWFDLDDPALREAIHAQPRLVHFVAATRDASSSLKALHKMGIDRGLLLPAERESPAGTLRWCISIRPDGQRLFYGGLPTLIEWGDVHPADTMPDAGLRLQSLAMRHPRADDLRAAHAAIGLQGVEVTAGAPNLVATLMTPRGVLAIESAGT
jgi:hypothetical protein